MQLLLSHGLIYSADVTIRNPACSLLCTPVDYSPGYYALPYTSFIGCMVMGNIRAKVMVSSEYEGGTIYHSKICSGGTISALIMGPVKIITALSMGAFIAVVHFQFCLQLSCFDINFSLFLDNQLGALELPGQPTGHFGVAWTTNWALWSCLDNQLGALELPGQPTGRFGVAWTTNWVLWSWYTN